jgi:PAS domain S-box-containing protein
MTGFQKKGVTMAENMVRTLPSELAESQMRDTRSTALKTASRVWLKAGDIMSRDVAAISPQSTVVSAVRIMSNNKISCLIVTDNGRLSGIVTETDILKKAVAGGNDFRKMIVEQIMSSPVRSIDRDLSVMETSKIMEAENIRRLVVLEDERFVGIITQTDMVQALASYSISQEVSEIMTSNVAVITSSASVKEAAELMASKDISCLVAMEKDAVVGIFTERDLLKRVVALKRNPAHTRLKKVMSSPAVTVSSDCSVLSANKLLERIGIRRLIVMDDETLLGVITQTDILKAIKTRLQEEEEHYFRLMSESSNCIYTIDLDLNTTYVNPAFMKLLDVTDPDELISKPFLPERFWNNPQERKQHLGRLKSTSMEVKELNLKTANGRRLFVTLFSTCIKNFKGEICGCQGVLYDVTAQQELVSLKEVQQQLHRSEDLLRGVLESTSDGILVIDEKGRMSHMNKRFAQLWDIPEELVQQPDNERLLEHIGSRLEDSPAFLEKLQAPDLIREQSLDVLHLKKGKVLEIHSMPLTQEGTGTVQIWSFRDITLHKKAQENLVCT